MAGKEPGRDLQLYEVTRQCGAWAQTSCCCCCCCILRASALAAGEPACLSARANSPANSSVRPLAIGNEAPGAPAGRSSASASLARLDLRKLRRPGLAEHPVLTAGATAPSGAGDGANGS